MSTALQVEIENLREQVAFYKSELGLVSDAGRHAIFRRRWKLTPYEASLLDALYSRAGRLMTRDLLMTKLYPDGDEPEIHIVNVFLCRLRRKVGPGLIETDWGHGYRLTPAGVSICYALVSGADR